MARVVEAKESRLRIERRPEGLHLLLPRRRQAFRFVAVAWFALIWLYGLVGMVMGEPPEDSGGVAFIVLWNVIGVVGVSVALWGALHREELVVDAQHLTHSRSLGPIRRGRAYVRARIEDLRVSAEKMSQFDPRAGMRLYGIGGGIIAFDYGDRTVHLGDLEEAEAKRVVAALEAEGLR